jgi:hypothetical protein
MSRVYGATLRRSNFSQHACRDNAVPEESPIGRSQTLKTDRLRQPAVGSSSKEKPNLPSKGRPFIMRGYLLPRDPSHTQPEGLGLGTADKAVRSCALRC